MGVLEFLVPFYPINTARVVFSSDLKMDPLNLYPTYGKASGDCEKASEEDPVTKNNCATVIEDKLVRGGVETHPGPGPSNLVSTF